MAEVLQENKVWMPDGVQEMAKRSPDEQLKIAIVGAPKSGKSRLAATAPKKPIYFFDYDGRLASVAGIPDVFGKTYSDTTNLRNSIAWNEIERDMNLFEYNKGAGKEIPGTIIHDSITFLIDRIARYLVTSSPLLRREIKITDQVKTWIAGGFDYYKAEADKINNLITRTFELGVDVIAIFHERPEEAPDSTSDNPKFTGKVSVHPPRTSTLLSVFNELWRVQPDGFGNYKVTTRPSYEFTGATCLQIDKEEDADINKMLQKHKQKLNSNYNTNLKG